MLLLTHNKIILSTVGCAATSIFLYNKTLKIVCDIISYLASAWPKFFHASGYSLFKLIFKISEYTINPIIRTKSGIQNHLHMVNRNYLVSEIWL